MIARLRGQIAAIGEDGVVLDVAGVGYQVYCSPRTLRDVSAGAEALVLHIETQMREDSITLYGFLDPAERGWFRLLQNIQGVGARTALALLGVLSPEELMRAIAAQDRTLLTRAAGVGPRLAARIVSELKDRVGALPVPAARAEAGAAVALPVVAGPAADAVSALVNLGYGRAEAYGAVARVQARLGEAAGLDALIRESLRELAA